MHIAQAGDILVKKVFRRMYLTKPNLIKMLTRRE